MSIKACGAEQDLWAGHRNTEAQNFFFELQQQLQPASCWARAVPKFPSVFCVSV